jgi:hypothetical protein
MSISYLRIVAKNMKFLYPLILTTGRREESRLRMESINLYMAFACVRAAKTESLNVVNHNERLKYLSTVGIIQRRMTSEALHRNQREFEYC